MRAPTRALARASLMHGLGPGPRYRLMALISAVKRMSYLLQGNVSQYGALVARLQDPAVSSDPGRHPLSHADLLGEAERLLHNVLTAMSTRVDQQRCFMTAYFDDDPGLMQEYRGRVASDFTASAEAAFLKGLRNYIAHRQLPSRRIYAMTSTSTGAGTATAVGLRVILPRIPVLASDYSSRQNVISLPILHDALGLLDEFCSITNLGSMLEAGEFDSGTLSALEELHRARMNDPDHADFLVQLDSDIRGMAGPIVRRVSMNSPLTIELIGSLSTGALFLLKNPGMIGSWIPRVRESWFHAQAEAARAKRAYRELTRTGIEVEELDD